MGCMILSETSCFNNWISRDFCKETFKRFLFETNLFWVLVSVDAYGSSRVHLKDLYNLENLQTLHLLQSTCNYYKGEMFLRQMIETVIQESFGLYTWHVKKVS